MWWDLSKFKMCHVKKFLLSGSLTGTFPIKLCQKIKLWCRTFLNLCFEQWAIIITFLFKIGNHVSSLMPKTYQNCFDSWYLYSLKFEVCKLLQLKIFRIFIFNLFNLLNKFKINRIHWNLNFDSYTKLS